MLLKRRATPEAAGKTAALKGAAAPRGLQEHRHNDRAAATATRRHESVRSCRAQGQRIVRLSSVFGEGDGTPLTNMYEER